MNPIIATTPLTDGISNLLEVLGVWIGWGFIEILPGAIATVSALWLFDKLKYPVRMAYKKTYAYFKGGAMAAAKEQIDDWERESAALSSQIERFVQRTANSSLSSYFGNLTNNQTRQLTDAGIRILEQTAGAIESFQEAQKNQAGALAQAMFNGSMPYAMNNDDILKAYERMRAQYSNSDQSQEGRTGGLGTYATTPDSKQAEVVPPDINDLVIEKLGIEDSAQYYYWYPSRGETLTTALSTQKKIDGYGLKKIMKAFQGSGELEVKHVDVRYVPRSDNNKPRTTYTA